MLTLQLRGAGRITLIVVLFVGANPLFAQTYDQVYGPRGLPNNGNILRMNKMQVELQASGSNRTFTVDEIRKINYADDPPELDRARQHVVEKRYEDAVEELKKINVNSIKQDRIRADIQFYQASTTTALALRGQASLTTAARMMIDFANAHPDNYHYFEAVKAIADLAFALGRFSNAKERYVELYQAPGTDYKVSARLRVGECELAEEKYNEALKTFQQVVDTDLGNYDKAEEKKMSAQVGRAVCLSATGKVQEGVKAIEQIIKDGDPRNMSLFGRAYNGLGACHLQAGNKKDALMAYLHTDVLFYQDTDAHAEALYHLSKLWQEQRKADRAVRAQQLLKTRYKGTLWAQKQ